MNNCFIVDIGATKIKIGIYGLSLNQPEIIFNTPSSSKMIIKSILHKLDCLKKLYPNTKNRIIIASPGLITKEGIIQKSIYINLEGINLKNEIEKESSYEVAVENDANLQALGAYNKKTLLYMVIGTGVGGAFIYDGCLMKGYQGFSCEFGHVYIGGYKKCYCGNSGCLDTIISGKAMTNILGNQWWKHTMDEQIHKYILFAGKKTGSALARLSIVFDPEEIILCGLICNIKSFVKSVNVSFKNEIWGNNEIIYQTNSWINIYNGTKKFLF